MDEIVELYRTRARLVLGITALLQVPAQAVNVVLGIHLVLASAAFRRYALVDPGAPAAPLPPLEPGVVADLLGTSGAILLTSAFAAGLTSAVLALVIVRLRLGREVTVPGAFRALVGRLGALALTFIAYALAIATVMTGGVLLSTLPIGLTRDPGAGGVLVFLGILTFVAFLAGLVFLSTRWAFWPQVVLLEGRAGRGPLGRSWRLVTGSTWRVIGYSLLFGLAAGILGGLLVQLGNLAVDAALPGVDDLVAAGLRFALGAVSTVLVTPIPAAALTLLYLDLRLRRGEPMPTA